MSAFWGGFAAKGVEYIDEARKNSLDKTKLDDARKFETTEWDRRNAINRDEKLKDEELRYARDSYFKPENISQDADGTWFTTIAPDASGKLVFNRVPASEAQKTTFTRAEQDRARELTKDNLEIEGKQVGISAAKQRMGLDAAADRRAAEAHALEVRGGGKSRAKGDRTSLESLTESLAKNNKVAYAGSKPTAANNGKAAGFTVTTLSQKNANLVREVLRDPKWEGRYNKLSLRAIAQLAEEGDVEASVVISEVAPYLTFLD